MKESEKDRCTRVAVSILVEGLVAQGHEKILEAQTKHFPSSRVGIPCPWCGGLRCPNCGDHHGPESVYRPGPRWLGWRLPGLL